MAGHNKWSQIKHKKAKTDAQRGKAFTKVVREILMAVKQGGPDPEMNARLRLAVQKAKSVNMPNDNIKRAIQKGSGNDENTNYEETTYEAYGNNGIGLIINILTDNKNRTLPNIKMILNKNGGALATPGSVSYMFSKKGVLLFEPGTSEEIVMDIATENGAEDILIHDDHSIEVITTTDTFEAVQQAFESQNIPILKAEIESVAENNIELETIEDAQKLLNLIEKIEEDDDIQSVYGNYTISDQIAEQLG